jgi:hypothetical protein
MVFRGLGGATIGETYFYMCINVKSLLKKNSITTSVQNQDFKVMIPGVGEAVMATIGKTIFSSPELKAQVSYSDHPLSVVRLSVRPSVRLSVNFYIFDFFSRTTGPILTRLGTNHPWGEGILNC